jgi:hypothetical protein
MTKENIYDLIKAHATELVDGRFRFKKVDLKEACAELEDCFKRLHKPVVSVKQPDHKTIRAAAFEYAKWQTPPEWEQERKYAAKDFLAGAQWALSQVAGATAKGEERKE